MNERILIVENEPELAAVLRDYLQQSDFKTDCLENGLEVVPFVRNNNPDLILLDLMLPGQNGLNICREIRTFSNVPIIIVTARTEEIDLLLGLELGADDYICKPFSPRVVVARVKTVLRRSGTDSEEQKPAGHHQDRDLTLDEACYRATLADRDLPLSIVEFKLLYLLATNRGRIYSRSQLMSEIYDDHRVVYERTIDSHIKKLRKKMAAAMPGREYIHAVYGAGYKYDPEA